MNGVYNLIILWFSYITNVIISTHSITILTTRRDKAFFVWLYKFHPHHSLMIVKSSQCSHLVGLGECRDRDNPWGNFLETLLRLTRVKAIHSNNVILCRVGWHLWLGKKLNDKASLAGKIFSGLLWLEKIKLKLSLFGRPQ